MKLYLNDRLVVDAESEGSGVDVFFSSAFYDDTGEPLTDNELEKLGERYPELLDEQAFDRAICAAEYYYEGDR